MDFPVLGTQWDFQRRGVWAKVLSSAWLGVSRTDDHIQRRNKTNPVRYNVEGEMNLADLASAVGSTSRKVKQKIDRLTASGFAPDQAAERIMADWRLAL
jgi:hypothetical protein